MAKLTQNEELEIVKLYKEKCPLNELMRIFKTSHPTIKKIFKKCNVSLNGTRGFSQETKNEIFDLYLKDNLSLNAISKMYGFTPVTIANLFNKNKIKLRPNHAIKYNINDNYFNEINSHERAYWLGFLLTDGYMCESTKLITIALQTRDIEILENFKRCLDSDGIVKLFKSNKNKVKREHVYFRFNNTKIVSDLKKLGMTQAKSYTVEMPEIDDKYFYSFLLGAFDGDGCLQLFKKKSGGLQFSAALCSASDNFIKQILNKLNQFGFKFCYRKQIQKSGNYLYNLYTGHRIEGARFLDKLYENLDASFPLQRKRLIYLETKQSLIDFPVKTQHITHTKWLT